MLPCGTLGCGEHHRLLRVDSDPEVSVAVDLPRETGRLMADHLSLLLEQYHTKEMVQT